MVRRSWKQGDMSAQGDRSLGSGKDSPLDQIPFTH